MGKPEVGTPKYIANKIKAKGLQKLRWYCQMCQKQCRDENGFKCHTMSESHQRQLLLFADNQSTYLNQFSKEFCNGYLELLKRQFGTKRVHANRVYQEYISDRHHLHMNATQWETLTDFVKWLGREGKCVVDETEKGWFVTYIDRDPETIQLQEAILKKEKMDRDDHERNLKFLEKQIQRGKKSMSNAPEHTPTDLNRKDDEKITLNLTIKDNFKKPELINSMSSALSRMSETSGTNVKRKKEEKRKLSALEEIIKDEEQKKRKTTPKDHWLVEDIIVKVKTDTLGEKYYNKKGVVEKVIDKYGAVVKMLDSNHKLKLDQAHLETVIPNIGRKVKILTSSYYNMIGELVGINTDMFCASVRITSGPCRGKILDKLQYEHISKLNIA